MKHKHKAAKGGAMKHEKEPVGETATEELKKGGKVKKKEHEAHGKKEHHRADKRARGGRMSPSSPLSGAAPKTMRSDKQEND